MGDTGGAKGSSGSADPRASGWRETMRVYVRDPEVSQALDDLGRGLASVVLLAGRRWLARERPAGLLRLELQAAARDLEHVAGFLRGIETEPSGGEGGAEGRSSPEVEEAADEVLRLAAEVERLALKLRRMAEAEGEEGEPGRGGGAPRGGAR